jgi:hypothetical protein
MHVDIDVLLISLGQVLGLRRLLCVATLVSTNECRGCAHAPEDIHASSTAHVIHSDLYHLLLHEAWFEEEAWRRSCAHQCGHSLPKAPWKLDVLIGARAHTHTYYYGVTAQSGRPEKEIAPAHQRQHHKQPQQATATQSTHGAAGPTNERTAAAHPKAAHERIGAAPIYLLAQRHRPARQPA